MTRTGRAKFPSVISAIGFLALAGVAPTDRAHAAGDLALGEYLSSECATCHQSSGRQTGGIPAITGLPADQFIAAMEAYKGKVRANRVMQTLAGRLTGEEIAALAAYYESLKPADPNKKT